MANLSYVHMEDGHQQTCKQRDLICVVVSGGQQNDRVQESIGECTDDDNAAIRALMTGGLTAQEEAVSSSRLRRKPASPNHKTARRSVYASRVQGETSTTSDRKRPAKSPPPQGRGK